MPRLPFLYTLSPRGVFYVQRKKKVVAMATRDYIACSYVRSYIGIAIYVAIANLYNVSLFSRLLKSVIRNTNQ